MRRMVIKFTFSLSLGIKLVLTLKIIKFIIQSQYVVSSRYAQGQYFFLTVAVLSQYY